MSQALRASAGRKAMAAAAKVERPLDERSGFRKVQWRQLSDALQGLSLGGKRKSE